MISFLANITQTLISRLVIHEIWGSVCKQQWTKIHFHDNWLDFQFYNVVTLDCKTKFVLQNFQISFYINQFCIFVLKTNKKLKESFFEDNHQVPFHWLSQHAFVFCLFKNFSINRRIEIVDHLVFCLGLLWFACRHTRQRPLQQWRTWPSFVRLGKAECSMVCPEKYQWKNFVRSLPLLPKHSLCQQRMKTD